MAKEHTKKKPQRKSLGDVVKVIFHSKAFLITALLLPIVLFSLRLLLTGNKIIPGDPDYSFQLYGAFRRSVLEFHQFPWINPWIGGGIPLFNNIQFGLLSIQTPFVLLFGAVLGTKVAILAYQIIGFFGFRRLLFHNFKSPTLRANLLAYIPIFGGFMTYRSIAGHFTFLLITLFPWLLSFFLDRASGKNWLWFSLVMSLMIWSSPHYITIMTILVIGIWYALELTHKLMVSYRNKSLGLFFKQQLQSDINFVLKAGGLTVLLCFYRMYFVYTFIRDYPRPALLTNEPFTGIRLGLYAIWGPNQYHSSPHLPSGWGWVEASAYIGVFSFFALMLVLIPSGWIWFKSRRIKSMTQVAAFSYPVIILLLLFLVFFSLGMGNFAPYSPYALLHNLPIFSSMRVATRWLEWASLASLMIIGAYRLPQFQRLINVCLGLAVVELFVTSSTILGNSYFIKIEHYRSPRASFNQVAHYNIPRPLYSQDKNFMTVYAYDENLYETTENNLGQIIAGDALIDTRQPNTTIRCGSNHPSCNFISTNAIVSYWSPNKIILTRKAAGPINLNINPGRAWRVNGKYVFTGYKIVDPKAAFIVNDPSTTIILDYVPHFSPEWLLNKL